MELAPNAGDPESRVGTTVAGRFFLHRLIGRGGTSDVYQATWVGPDRPVALKLLRAAAEGEAQRRRFEREAAAASRLGHPGCAELLETGRCADGSLWLAMELVPGRDLARVIAEDGPLPPEVACRIADQLLATLAAAHGQGILHRDLKPANVMLAPRPDGGEQVKVLDFGIAWLEGLSNADGRLTEEGQVPGTPAYMSPEQVRGEELDARSDLYAAGVVLYEMLVGTPPFEAPTALALVARQLADPPPPLRSRCPGAPAPLEALVARALAKDRAGRPASAEAMREELRAAMAGAPAPARRPTPAPETEVLPASPGHRRRRSAAAAALGAGSLLLAGAWMAWRPGAIRAGAPGNGLAGLPAAVAAVPEVARPAARPAAPPAVATAPAPPVGPAAPVATPPPRRSRRPPEAAPASPEPAPPSIRLVRGELNSVPTPPGATGDGVLVLQAIPWAEVTVAGTSLGETPRELRLAAGTYAVRAVHPDLGAREEVVVVRPGERVLWTAKLAE